ncbi:MAG TPA: hypothetical protein VFR01_07640, partial [Geobacterales bacterium]|nr:hypothetical protein [Geobacterales bacterium]
MHRNRGTILAALLLLPTLATGAELTMRGDTIIRFEEQSAPGMADQTLIPATQFLALDARSLGDGNLSLHLYGWGRVDLADQSRADGDTDGDLGYAYLQYRAPKGDAEMKLGRLWVYEGVASEKVDGIFLRSDLAGGFTASFFGGAPVEPDHQENVGDYVVGGRLGFRTAGMLELGVSGLHENGVVTGPSSDLKTDRQLVGGDVWFAPVRFLEVTGHTHYNIVTDGVAEHSYLLSIKPMPVLQLAGEYEEHNFEHYFASTNLRSLFT